MAAVAAGLHQFAVEVDAAGIAAVAEALADVHRAVAAKQAHHLGVVAEDIAVLAVLDLRQARDGLGAGIQVAVGRAVVLGLDTAHGDLHVVLEFGTTVAEQALAGILDFGISLFFRISTAPPLSTRAKSSTGTMASRRTLDFRVRRIINS